MIKSKPEKEDYRVLISNEWNDIHHSRMQEWSALGVITGAHVGIISLLESFSGNNKLLIFTLVVGVLFCTFGILLTMRHRHLMIIKFGWLYEAEDKLGLIKDEENPHGIIPRMSLAVKKKNNWKGLAFPRLLSTSGLILLLYFSIFLIDILAFSFYNDLIP